MSRLPGAASPCTTARAARAPRQHRAGRRWQLVGPVLAAQGGSDTDQASHWVGGYSSSLSVTVIAWNPLRAPPTNPTLQICFYFFFPFPLLIRSLFQLFCFCFFFYYSSTADTKCSTTFRLTAMMGQVCTLCSAHQKWSRHLSPQDTITTPLTIFPLPCLSSACLALTSIHSARPPSLSPPLWQPPANLSSPLSVVPLTCLISSIQVSDQNLQSIISYTLFAH